MFSTLYEPIEKYKYKVKLFVPKPITRHLHQFQRKFNSINNLKERIIQDLQEEFPEEPNVDVGYYEGRQSSKIWLVTSEDLRHMYSLSKNGEVPLWVEYKEDETSNDEEESAVPKKSKLSTGTKRQWIEDQVDEIYKVLELFERHGDSNIYSGPQLRLWAKMIQCGTYDDYEDPPRVPQITGIISTKKKSEQSESLTEAVTGAAVAIKNAQPKTAEHTVTICGPSPGKCTV